MIRGKDSWGYDNQTPGTCPAPRFVFPQAIGKNISLDVSPFSVLLLPQHISSAFVIPNTG